jgi:hypothetical protein
MLNLLKIKLEINTPTDAEGHGNSQCISRRSSSESFSTVLCTCSSPEANS